MRRTAPAVAALGLGLALALALSGCLSNPLDQLVESGVEQIIEDQSGVDVNVDSGGGATLPGSWPAEVPTVEGKVAFSAAIDSQFSASIEVGSSAEGEGAYDDMVAAGFTQVTELDLGAGTTTRIFENETYSVVVAVLPSGDGSTIVQYTVTPLTQ